MKSCQKKKLICVKFRCFLYDEMHFKDDISAKLTFFYIFQVFQKFVEIGRVAVIAGEGKIAAIVDVIDQVCPPGRWIPLVLTRRRFVWKAEPKQREQNMKFCSHNSAVLRCGDKAWSQTFLN